MDVPFVFVSTFNQQELNPQTIIWAGRAGFRRSTANGRPHRRGNTADLVFPARKGNVQNIKALSITLL